jgi:DNA-binding MarR family transcriptional regulator
MHVKSLARETSPRPATTWHRPLRPDGAQADGPRTAQNDGDRRTRLVMREQQAARLRSNCFPELKLRNPLWDMLVALLAAKRSGSQLSMSDLCLMSDAPESTALRLIHQLREKGYADMVPDRSDRRRTRVTLTTLGEAQFDLYLDRFDLV